MTQEELAYHNSRKEIEDETWTRAEKIHDSMLLTLSEESTKNLNAAKSALREYAKQWGDASTLIQGARMRLGELQPPPLFGNYHNQLLIWYDANIEMSSVAGRFFFDCADNILPCLERLQTTEGMPLDLQRLGAKLESCSNALQDAGNAFNEELRNRVPSRESWVGELSVSVSYQPPFAPLKIGVDQNGQIKMSSEVSIPTPLGTFSIGGEVQTENVRVIRIIQGNKVTVYNMGDSYYVIELDLKGKALLSYDGKGNIEIRISGD